MISTECICRYTTDYAKIFNATAGHDDNYCFCICRLVTSIYFSNENSYKLLITFRQLYDGFKLQNA